MTHLIKFFMILALSFPLVITVERISIPHDVHPGFSIKKLHFKGQSFHVIDNEVSSHFTLLNDGSLITTRKVSHLTKQPVNLLIEEEFDGRKILQPLTIHIRDRQNMLAFPKSAYNGYIFENELPGTLVENIGSLVPLNAVGNVSYFLSGSDNFRVYHNGDVASIISGKQLDRENQKKYILHLNASDSEGCSTSTLINVEVKDVNDNPPVFFEKFYTWNVSTELPLYSVIGSVKAIDADGDKPLYNFVDSNYNRVFVIVPQTGEIILIQQPEAGTYNYLVQADDNLIPPLYSDIIPVIVNVNGVDYEEEEEMKNPWRRSKLSIRQTQTYEHFNETDGNRIGKVMFSLERVHPDEVFSLENGSRWIDVDTNGDVKVKEPWDYEQLVNEKTIEFWVQIRAPQQPEPDRQKIIIHVQDSNDENPYFINSPMPMQAVVPLNAPIGTKVFKLQARDPDLDSNIHYFMSRDRTGGRFAVDEITGDVMTFRPDAFTLDHEYVIYVIAEDMNGKVNGNIQFTTEERLSIIGGRRPPQFFRQSYSATIPENKEKHSEIIHMKAKSFARRQMRYKLAAVGRGAGTFTIGPNDGVVKLANDLNYEDLRQPKKYWLMITATEDSEGFSTSVELNIDVTDVNDNPPRFEVPEYQAHGVPEDLPIGSSILKVSAIDPDSGNNSEISYSLDKEDFTIDSRGVIYSNKRLDANITNTYELTVRAVDKGEPPLTGTATVRIYTENRIDESPTFSQDVNTASVDENTGPSTVVPTIVASDIDGDNNHTNSY